MANWAKGERRRPTFPLGLLGAKAEVVFQPKGIVGVVSPWNFPIGMVFVPMAGILAAGNRAMIKPSEFTENTSALMARLVPDYFDERSEEHTSELQSLMRTPYAGLCLKKHNKRMLTQ